MSEGLEPHPHAFSPILRLNTQVGEKSPARGFMNPGYHAGSIHARVLPATHALGAAWPAGLAARRRDDGPGSWGPGTLRALAAWLPSAKKSATAREAACTIWIAGLLVSGRGADLVVGSWC